MNRRYLIALGVSAFSLAIFWLWNYAPPPSPSNLAKRALSASQAEERELAVAQLTMLKDPEVKDLVLRVAKESTDPKTLVLAINKIGSDGHLNDERVDLMLTYMSNADKPVRDAALSALVKRFGNPLPDNLEYGADDTADKRATLANKLREVVEKQKQKAEEWKRKLADPSLIAKAPSAPPPPPVDPAVEPSTPPAPPVTTAPAPPAPSVAPSPPAAAPLPVSQADYPGITMVVWICRALAVMVLLAELAGALSMVIGELRMSTTPKNKVPAAAGPTEDIFVRNSLASWLKIAVLVAGAIGIVALLATSEMLAARRARRAKLDYLSRSR